jgi:hypothetical protein
MQRHPFPRPVALVCGSVLCLIPPSACAQSRPAQATVPDLSGVWSTPGFKHREGEKIPDIPVIGLTRFNRKDYPFKPGGEQLYNRRFSEKPNPKTDDPQLLCLPWGFPHQTFLSNVQHFFQPEGYLVIFYEDMHYTRVIPMDGRRRAGLAPTYYGNSVGRYDGDTAVIDTVGLKPWGLDDGGRVPDGNHMFTDAAHFIERYRRTGPGTMSYTLTIDDPKIFTKPFTCGARDSHCFVDGNPGPEEWIMRLHPEWEVIEQYCEENNKDPGLLQFLEKK